jgi:hypothetical protein
MNLTVPSIHGRLSNPPVVYDERTIQVGRTLANQVQVRCNPVLQPTASGIVPDIHYNRGWVAPKFDRNGQHYTELLQSPDVAMVPHSYSVLIAAAAKPQQTPNLVPVGLSAPSIQGYY